jgi:hypothetical protein
VVRNLDYSVGAGRECPVTPFYRRGSQEKYFTDRGKRREIFSRLPAHVRERGDRNSPSARIHLPGVTTPSVSGASKQRGGNVPTTVLSETRGLSLFLVVRGGIELTKRLAVLVAHSPPNGVMDAHPRTRAPEELSRHHPTSIREWKGPPPSAQAAGCFRCSASKHTPFFQTNRVMAAILRANVSRAMCGFIPRVKQAW